MGKKNRERERERKNGKSLKNSKELTKVNKYLNEQMYKRMKIKIKRSMCLNCWESYIQKQSSDNKLQKRENKVKTEKNGKKVLN